jgi:formate hydrogenlyase subunit 3/multisubunit Na+/H+ antiporter MnhD subunit
MLAPGVPLILGLAAFASPSGMAPAFRLLPFAAVPALALAFVPPGAELDMPWLLLGSVLSLDAVGRVLLLLTAILWAVSSVYASAYHSADARRERFAGFFLLTMAGNFGLLVAADAVTFYFAFALMSFSAYGLVVHTGTGEARRAGRVYLVMAVIGEALLVAGLILAAVSASSLALPAMAEGVSVSPHRNWIVALLLSGFGIKAGALPLHMWLPLAHPVAPTAASAVLSGCMIKAGLLGWMKFLPLGLVAMPRWGTLLIVLGLAAAFAGVLIGITQTAPKTILAYSSISQMGIINVGVGIGLATGSGWSLAAPAVLLYAVHHGFAKGALFLGTGVVARTAPGSVARRAAFGGMIFAALALAGAPLTSGSVAKRYLKDVVAVSPDQWPVWLDVLLPLTAVGTTALMAVLLLRLAAGGVERDAANLRGLAVPWVAALGAAAMIVWLLPRAHPLGVEPPGFPYSALVFDAVWPLALGLTLVTTAAVVIRRIGIGAGTLRIEAGDVLVPMERLLRFVTRLRPSRLLPPPAAPALHVVTHWYRLYSRSGPGDLLLRGELALTRWEVGAGLLVVLALALALLIGVFRG